MIQLIIPRAVRVFKRYSIFFLIIVSLSLYPYQSAYSQDYEKMVDITKAMNMVLAELDSCKNDLDCMLIVSKKLEKLTKELEAAQNTKTNKQNANIPNTNSQIGEQPNIPIPPPTGQNPNPPPSINTLDKFPPPFESITQPWLEHITATNPKPGEPADCELINKTREELLRKISKIYDKEDSIKAWVYPITIAYCSEALVVTEEQGEINIPYAMKLKYKIHTEEKPSWIVTYELFFDKNNSHFGDKFYFRLWEASSTSTLIKENSGWILDNSVDPPVTLPIDQVSLLSTDKEDKVWEYGFGGSNIPYTHISPAGYNSKGEITDYMLWLHYEPTRFYPKGYPELYVESYSGTVFEKLSKEDILSALKQGEYNASYNETDFTGTTNVTKEVTITFKPTKCDSANSAGSGAIVLSGDCIDHGGQVIASKSGFFVNNKPVALIGDEALCIQHGSTKIVASETVAVVSGNKQIARIGDKTDCGATIIGGSKNTFAGIK